MIDTDLPISYNTMNTKPENSEFVASVQKTDYDGHIYIF